MIEARAISEITYGLVRQLSDRIHMAWEDDRGHLLREIYALKRFQKKEKSTQDYLKRQISILASRMEEHFPSQPLEMQSSKSSNIPNDIFEIETQHLQDPVDEQARFTQKEKSDETLMALPEMDLRDDVEVAVDIDSPLPNLKATKDTKRKFDSHNKCGHRKRAFKYSETLRGRKAREKLKGFSCSECEGYYRALEQQGIHVTRDSALQSSSRRCCKESSSDFEGKGQEYNMPARGGLASVYGESRRQKVPEDLVQLHSRHRDRSTPPSTPEGFWDLTILTPEEWKKSDHQKTTEK